MQTEQNQQLSEKEVTIIPHLEDNIPLPKNAREALPELSNEEELEMMANTIKLISDLTGEPIQATKEDIAEAKTVAEAMIKNPENKIQLKKYKNSMLASLAGMVAELDSHVVNDLKDLKTFVVNGLIKEAATAEKSKERITALRAIGEVDGVDAFKRTTEVVHKNMSMDDIEDKLRTLVNKLQKRIEDKEKQSDSQVIDAEVVKDE
jgi:ribosome-associated translation inhibitor RaiA